MTELETDLSAWCQSYVDAFNAGDAPAIAAHWTFPALTTQAGRSYVFKSEEHFAKNTAILLGFYEAQSVDRVERKLVSAHLLHKDTASMIVSDTMYTAGGDEIASWQAAYVLQRVQGGWKAVMAVADGETEAWAARGTPLGG
ncbi:MAG: hypothetical protein HRT82_00805 [Henriciella sp.]|nr:hypothetical protein [Henriciella sp.]